MSHLARRLFTLVLSLCLLCSAAFSLAEEATADAPDEEYLLTYRFGMDAKVETDENGEPVSVNGYPTQLVRAGFNNLGQQESFQMEIDFVDYERRELLTVRSDSGVSFSDFFGGSEEFKKIFYT